MNKLKANAVFTTDTTRSQCIRPHKVNTLNMKPRHFSLLFCYKSSQPSPTRMTIDFVGSSSLSFETRSLLRLDSSFIRGRLFLMPHSVSMYALSILPHFSVKPAYIRNVSYRSFVESFKAPWDTGLSSYTSSEVVQVRVKLHNEIRYLEVVDGTYRGWKLAELFTGWL